MESRDVADEVFCRNCGLVFADFAAAAVLREAADDYEQGWRKAMLSAPGEAPPGYVADAAVFLRRRADKLEREARDG